MAQAFLNMEKYADAKECAVIVRGILDERENTTLDDALGFIFIADVYKQIREFETALSLLRKGLLIIQEEKEIHAHMMKTFFEKLSKFFVPLLLLTRNFEEAIPYLEAQVETAKKTFGLKHAEVVRVYGILGSAYFEVNKLQLAAQSFAYAKDIWDESPGPQHVDSIRMCKSLYTTHRAMGSYSLAITFLEETIRRLELLGGPSAQSDLAEAAIFMEELKKMVADPANDSQYGSIPKTNNTKGRKKVTKRVKISKMKASINSNISESVVGLKISKQ